MSFLAWTPRHPVAAAAFVVLALAGGPGCGGSKDDAKPGAVVPPVTDEPFAEAPSPYESLPPAVREAMDKSFTGDLDGMIERRVIRAGVTFNRTHYFIDKGQQRGATYEAVKLFEDDLNKAAKTGALKINLVFVPLPRDQLYKALIDGKVDFVAAHGDRHAGAREAGGLLRTDPHGREPGGRHRSGRAADRLAGRSVRARSLHPQVEPLRGERRGPEHPADGARQGRRDHPRGASRSSKTTTCSRW